MHYYLQVLFSALTSFLIAYLSIPSIIKVAELKKLYDEPGSRTSHDSNIPTLGGLAIFAGLIFSVTFWVETDYFKEIQFIIAAIVLMFFIGIKDDIIAIDPLKKFLIQIVAATILVVWGDIRLTSMYGIFYIQELPYWFSIILSIITIIMITNSFNLIDGIDALSGFIGIIVSVTFGISFCLIYEFQFAILAFALAGALLAFVRFNITPAKIFMGDTGSLLIGLVSAVLAIKFIEINKQLPIDISMKAVPSIAIGILIIPLFDTCRVFVIRILQRKSPFGADQNHLHHLIIKSGATHMEATLILSLVNLVFIGIVFLFQSMGAFILLLLITCLATLLTGILILIKRKVNTTKVA